MTETSDERRRRILAQQFATPADAGFLVNKDKATINRWIAKGLPVYEIEGQRFVRLSEVRAWVTDPDTATRRRSGLMRQ